MFFPPIFICVTPSHHCNLCSDVNFSETPYSPCPRSMTHLFPLQPLGLLYFSSQPLSLPEIILGIYNLIFYCLTFTNYKLQEARKIAFVHCLISCVKNNEDTAHSESLYTVNQCVGLYIFVIVCNSYFYFCNFGFNIHFQHYMS